jgi:putative aldouronate transport system substrate-binding protein
VNIASPASPDELREALQTVKGKTKLIPLTGSGYRLTAIMSGFGLNTQWQTDGKTFTNWIESNAFQQYLTYMADLYEDGLVDTGWADNTAESAAAKQDAGEAFAMVRAWDDPATLAGGHTALIVAPLAKGGTKTYGVSAAPESFVVVPATCADPVKVMDYLNIRAQAPHPRRRVGVEGVQYELGTEHTRL